jgi:phage repressor protein C with HTH and peptisase S24 domain
MSSHQDKSVLATRREEAFAVRIGKVGIEKDRYLDLRSAALGQKLPNTTDLSLSERLVFAWLVLIFSYEDEEIERLIGRSLKQYWRYVEGHDVPLSVLFKIAKVTGIQEDFLILGRLVPSLEDAGFGGEEKRNKELSYIKRYDVRASAGPGALVAHEDLNGGSQFLALRTAWLHQIGVNPGRAEVLIAVGDSMEPTIRDGDLLLIDRALDRVVDNGIYVLVLGGMVLVKRIQTLRDGSAVLKSDNQRYNDEVIPAHELPDLKVEGRVRWFGRTI